jgi:hypothetical protein
MTHRLFNKLQIIVICLGLNAAIIAIGGDEPHDTVKPITEAGSVIAVYYNDWRLLSSGGPAIIFVAWPDGTVVWSDDPVKGGAPYRAGRVEPQKVATLLEEFEKEGIFDEKELNAPHFGPDSEFVSVLIKSGTKQVKMESWHELTKDFALSVGANGVPAGQRIPRLKWLREMDVEELFFRLVWSETRAKLSKLISCDSKPTAGFPVMKAGVLSWQEPTGPQKSFAK